MLFQKYLHKTILIVLLCCLSAFSEKAYGQEDDTKIIVSTLDSLHNLWYLKKTSPIRNKKAENTYGFKANEIPQYDDSVYNERIKQMDIETPMPFVYNEHVQRFIDLYAFRKRDLVEKMLGISEYYFPMFEEVLDKYDLPLELKYLAVVESALNTKACSPVKASGLWQFMYSTGILYRLRVTSYIDERNDPQKSTEAAARYLRDLHKNLYNDWFLALAAYNCGPGNVQKAIKRSGGKKTFWEIYRFLPAETRGYVPAFIAASYVFTYHKEHNLFPQVINLPTHVDTVMIQREANFSSISKYLNISEDLLLELNPQFKKGYIPATSKNVFTLKLPANKTTDFVAYKDSICDYFSNNYKSNLPTQYIAKNESNTNQKFSTQVTTNDSQKTESSSNNKQEDYTLPKYSWISYNVKSGEKITQIAKWFNVSVYELKTWNRLRSNTLKTGKKLVIRVETDKRDEYVRINRMTSAQKRYLLGEKNTSAVVKKNYTKNVEAKKVAKKPSKVDYYVVQKGDTLWSISQKFPGVSVADIKKSNGITNNNSLKEGQKIKIVRS